MSSTQRVAPTARTPDAAQTSETEQRRGRGARADRWGRSAEDAAAQWYRERGGEILAQRWRSEAGEVDLVVRLDGILVIVEVKARKGRAAALGAVTPREWTRLVQKAELGAAEFGGGDLRIDLAAINAQGEIEVIENAGVAGAL